MTNSSNFFRASAEDFRKIPGSPVAYWVSKGMQMAFRVGESLELIAHPRKGLVTTNNDRFLRRWYEIAAHNFSPMSDSACAAKESGVKWFPINKGGSFRRWYGNNEWVINWQNDGEEIKQAIVDLYHGGSFTKEIRSEDKYFAKAVTWSALSSGAFSVRYSPPGFVFGSGGYCAFPDDDKMSIVLGLMNSCVVGQVLALLSPTLNYEAGHIRSIPVVLTGVDFEHHNQLMDMILRYARCDWNAYETSWDFAVNPLMAEAGKIRNEELGMRNDGATIPHSSFSIPNLYAALRRKWAESCEEMRRLETENNRIFIEAYGLQDELKPDVPWNEITLTCNPWYRYGVRSDECGVMSAELPRDKALEERLKGDTVKELASYAVGCMMGRYSLDKPGLILADQGATIADYWEKVRSDECGVRSDECELGNETPHSALRPQHSFGPDEDGIIPILDNDWFADDIVTRFKEFIKVAFGEAHYLENIAWIEDALGKDIRSYFTKDFYKDHLQRYQNRPIYWLFQSPKGAFRALVYMHRYKPDMVGGVLGYLRSLQTKIDNQLDVAMQVGADESKSASERVRANKDAVKYAKAKKELDEYEKNVLYPLSTERIEIDLDDGVKVNYRKFGAALRKVSALEA